MVVGADEVRLAGLVCGPADGSRWHGRDDSWLDTLEESASTLARIQQLAALDETGHVPQLRIRCTSTGLQHRLNDVHWCGQRGCETSGNTTCHAVSDRVVLLLWVHDGGEGLVGEELQGVEWDGHGEGGWVGDVEGAETLVAEDGLGAGGHVWVESLGALDLHALLDDCVVSAYSAH